MSTKQNLMPAFSAPLNGSSGLLLSEFNKLSYNRDPDTSLPEWIQGKITHLKCVTDNLSLLSQRNRLVLLPVGSCYISLVVLIGFDFWSLLVYGWCPQEANTEPHWQLHPPEGSCVIQSTAMPPYLSRPFLRISIQFRSSQGMLALCAPKNLVQILEVPLQVMIKTNM